MFTGAVKEQVMGESPNRSELAPALENLNHLSSVGGSTFTAAMLCFVETKTTL